MIITSESYCVSRNGYRVVNAIRDGKECCIEEGMATLIKEGIISDIAFGFYCYFRNGNRRDLTLSNLELRPIEELNARKEEAEEDFYFLMTGKKRK